MKMIGWFAPIKMLIEWRVGRHGGGGVRRVKWFIHTSVSVQENLG